MTNVGHHYDAVTGKCGVCGVGPKSDSLAHLTAWVECGLEKWPDGKTGVCVYNQQPYEEFVLGYVIGGAATDDELCMEMGRRITALKEKREAKFISWRKPFELIEDEIGPEDIIIAPDRCTRTEPLEVRCINLRRRILRCRVLITAHANDEEWGVSPLMRGIQA